MGETDRRMDEARDAAQQAVTAVLHGDRDTAAAIVSGHLTPEALALVLLDLTAYVHKRWARSVGMTASMRTEAWSLLLLDIEADRNREAHRG